MLIIFSLISFSNYSFAEIEIKISVDKNEYLEAEPIICNLSFINNSDFPDSIDHDKLGLYYIKIQSPENKKIIYAGSIGDYIGSIRYRKIDPHGLTGSTFNLLNFFVEKIVTLNINSAPGYLSSGSYTIKYSYANKLTSNEIKININKPIDSELLVFEKLIKAYQINDGKPWIMDSILLKKDSYYDIVVNHPESVYWEEAVYRYNQECNWLKFDYTDIYVNKEFVKRFPNSINIRHILINLCQSIYLYEGGEPAVNFYLEYLIENYRKYDVSVFAKEQQIKKEYLN